MGALLADVRAEGFTVVTPPLVRGLSPLAPIPRLPRPAGTIPRRKARSGACAYAYQRLSGPPGRPRRRRAARGVHVPRLPVQPARPMAAPRGQPGHGMDRRPRHRCFYHRLHRGGGRRQTPRHRAQPAPRGQWPQPGGVPARSGRARRRARGPRRGRRCRGGHRRVAPGAPQGLPGVAGRHARRACRALGGGRAAGLRPRRRHGAVFRAIRPGPAPAPSSATGPT